jgi:hypothetical protein
MVKYECDQCKYETDNKYSYKRHCQTKKHQRNVEGDNSSDNKSAKKKVFKEKKVAMSKKNSKNTKVTKNPVEKTDTKQKVTPYLCSYCTTYFKTKGALTKHFMVCEEKKKRDKKRKSKTESESEAEESEVEESDLESEVESDVEESDVESEIDPDVDFIDSEDNSDDEEEDNDGNSSDSSGFYIEGFPEKIVYREIDGKLVPVRKRPHKDEGRWDIDNMLRPDNGLEDEEEDDGKKFGSIFTRHKYRKRKLCVIEYFQRLRSNAYYRYKFVRERPKKLTPMGKWTKKEDAYPPGATPEMKKKYDFFWKEYNEVKETIEDDPITGATRLYNAMVGIYGQDLYGAKDLLDIKEDHYDFFDKETRSELKQVDSMYNPKYPDTKNYLDKMKRFILMTFALKYVRLELEK